MVKIIKLLYKVVHRN